MKPSFLKKIKDLCISGFRSTLAKTSFQTGHSKAYPDQEKAKRNQICNKNKLRKQAEILPNKPRGLMLRNIDKRGEPRTFTSFYPN